MFSKKKRFILSLFLLLFCSLGVFAQNPITRVQSTTGNTGVNTATSFSVTLSSAPVSGNTLVAIIATRGSAAGIVTGISQTGATWTRAAQATNASGSTTEIWYAPNVSSAGNSITINQSNVRSAAVIVEYSNIILASPIDKTANTTGNSNAASTGTTATTVQANELLVGGVGLVNSGYTIGTPTNSFASVANAASTDGPSQNNAKVYALEKLVTTTGTAISGGSISSSSQWSGAIATFKAQTPTTTVVSSSNSSVAYGTTVTFTATVTPNTATGTVHFFDGATSLGTGTLSGTTTKTATFTTSATQLSAGTHSITAAYLGDNTNDNSTSSAVSQTITPKA